MCGTPPASLLSALGRVPEQFPLRRSDRWAWYRSAPLLYKCRMGNGHMSIIVSALQASEGGAGVARYQREVASAILRLQTCDVTVLLPRSVRREGHPPEANGGNRVDVRVPQQSIGRIVKEVWVLRHLASPDDTLLSLDIGTVGKWRRTFAVVHDLSFEANPAWYTASQVLWKTSRVRRLVERATAVICVSKFVRDDLVSRHDELAGRAVSVPSAVPTLPEPTPEDLLAVEAMLRPDAKNLVIVGTLTPQKHPRQFFEALRMLNRRGLRAHGWIIGRQGWHSAAIMREVMALQEEGLATWVPHTSDRSLAAWYKLADLVVHCSLYEGFGFVPGEAYAAGARVLCRRLPAVMEYLEDRITYFDGVEGEDLFGPIAELLSQPRVVVPSASPKRTWREVAQDLITVAAGGRLASEPRVAWTVE